MTEYLRIWFIPILVSSTIYRHFVEQFTCVLAPACKLLQRAVLLMPTQILLDQEHKHDALLLTNAYYVRRYEPSLSGRYFLVDRRSSANTVYAGSLICIRSVCGYTRTRVQEFGLKIIESDFSFYFSGQKSANSVRID
jgi:hypothetical protein